MEQDVRRSAREPEVHHRRAGSGTHVRIERVELPREADGHSRYDAAAALLREWLARGVLARDQRPAFYLYQMDFTDEHGRPRHTLGVIGALTLEPWTGAVVVAGTGDGAAV